MHTAVSLAGDTYVQSPSVIQMYHIRNTGTPTDPILNLVSYLTSDPSWYPVGVPHPPTMVPLNINAQP